MFCRKCGTQIDDNAAFCSKCGAPVNGEQQTYEQRYSDIHICRAPIYKRNIVSCLLLTIITCGIYGIYWFICMVDDANTASGTENGQSGGMVFLLTLITCGIYEYIWLYKVGGQLAEAKLRATGVRGDSINGFLYLLLSILGFGIVSFGLIQNELNQVAAYE